MDNFDIEKKLRYVDNEMSSEEKSKFESEISPEIKARLIALSETRNSLLKQNKALPNGYEQKLREKLHKSVEKLEPCIKSSDGSKKTMRDKIKNFLKNRKIKVAIISCLVLIISIPLFINSMGSRKSKSDAVIFSQSSEAAMESVMESKKEEVLDSNSSAKIYSNSSNRLIKDSNNANNPDSNNYTGRMIIVNSRVHITTDNYKEFSQKIEELMANSGGYIENKEIYSNQTFYNGKEKNLTSGVIELRVPKNSLDSLFNEIKSLGRVDSENVHSEDITSMYRDNKQRKENLEVREQALRKLMSKATKIEDIITIERELSNVRYEIDSISGNLKNWENLVDMSKITIQFDEVNSLNPEINPVNDGLMKKIRNTFVESINNIINLFEIILLFLVYNSVGIILILFVVAIIWYIAKRKR